MNDLPERPWPADRVERRPVAELVPYARNARTHSDAQVAQIAASIREWGWTTPILVDEEGGIIAGHGRVLAARKLGIAAVPVMVARGWTEAQRRAYVIADNQIALNAGWDTDVLKVELQDLDSLDFDLETIGFNADELSRLLDSDEDRAKAEETPEPPVNPVTVAGDVWILGSHRIVCGDSTKPEDVAKALNGVRPHLMVTDPPYGVEYDPNWRNERGLGGRAVGVVLNDDRADWSEAWALFPGEVAYVWHGALHATTVAESLRRCGFDLRAQIVWAKNHIVVGRGHYHWQHEPCWYAVKAKGTGHWSGARDQSTLWKIDKPQKSETGHSTQKPVECMRRPILNNSSAGQAVYEPFSGSGTTIMACELTGRACHAIELNPAYVDVAVKRWQDFTGQKALHAETGKTFEEMCDARYDAADDSRRSYDVAIAAMREKVVNGQA